MSYVQSKTIQFTESCLYLENNQIEYGRHHSEDTKSGPIDLQTESNFSNVSSFLASHFILPSIR